MIKQIIVISGIDGSGKTSVINGVRGKLESEGFSCVYKWMRFNHLLVRPLHMLAKVIGLTSVVVTPERKYCFHAYYKSKIFSKTYIILTYIDTLLSKRKIYETEKHNNYDYLICDRWIIDTLVDLRAKTQSHYNSKWDMRFFKILPPNSKQLVIVRSEQDILKARAENLADPEFKLKNHLYNEYANTKGIYKIENTGTIDESVHQLLEVLN